MPIYNKLVRDNIPQILHKQNLNFRHKILQEKEFQKLIWSGALTGRLNAE